MARDEHDREDLFAEATALSPRAELALGGRSEPVVIGLHRAGGLSLYFGPEEAWHFNPQGELRRAYLAGRLYKAEGGELVALDRERTSEAVHLVRDELDSAASERLLAALSATLAGLEQSLAACRYRLLRQSPDDLTTLATLRSALAQVPRPVCVAARPHAGG